MLPVMVKSPFLKSIAPPLPQGSVVPVCFTIFFSNTELFISIATFDESASTNIAPPPLAVAETTLFSVNVTLLIVVSQAV